MALLRRLTALRIVVSKGFDLATLSKSGDIVESKDKAQFEIAVAGEELREPLLLLLENRLREAHELYRAAERVTQLTIPTVTGGASTSVTLTGVGVA